MFVIWVCLEAQYCLGYGRIQGRAVDRTNGVLPNAAVRLIRGERSQAYVRVQTDTEGLFHIDNVAAGTYSVGLWYAGFRESIIQNVVVGSNGVSDLGSVPLDLAGCDAPGTSCSYHTSDPLSKIPPYRNTRQRRLVITRSCPANLDNVTAGCPENRQRAGRRAPDLSLETTPDGPVYLRPINGARISLRNADCSDAKTSIHPVRVDGLGQGSDLCVLTRSGRRVHIFLMSDILTAATEAELWCVSRK